MMFSNPTSVYVNNSDKKKFTYKSKGSTPFNWQPSDCNLSNTGEFNTMVFASNKKEALNIIEDMLFWFIETHTEAYIFYKNNRDQSSEYFEKSHLESIQNHTKLINNLCKCTVLELPTTQPYKIGWASNDFF